MLLGSSLIDGGQSYDQVMSSLGWLVYLPMTEASGNALDASGNGYNGTWAGTPQRQNTDGPSVGMGKAVRFSGDDVLNYYSAGLASAFTPGEFTISFWIYLNGGTGRFISIRTDPVDNNNRVLIYMSAATTLSFFYAAGGTAKNVDATGLTNSVWYNGTLTVSKSNDRMKAHINGAQVGSTQTGLGTWSGTPHANCVVIGAQDAALSSPFSGIFYRYGLANGEKTAADVTKIATAV